MNNSDAIIRDLEVMAGATNYRRWIYSQFDKYLGGRIVELGSGIGTFTELFLDRELVVAVDNHEPCIEYLKRRFSGHKNVIPLKRDIGSVEMLEVSYYKPHTVVCINVLEHVKDDMMALSHMFEILNIGGKAILLVPAFQSLYGSIDRLVGHYRRYSKRELTSKLIGTGFKIREAFYMNSLAVLGWLLNNRIIRRKEESLEQVLFYDRFIVPSLKNVERIVRPPLGLSIVAIAEKG